MFEIKNAMTIENFEGWEGGETTRKIIVEAGMVEEFGVLIDEIYPDGLTATELNDILWFEDEWVFEMLGIDPDDYDVD